MNTYRNDLLITASRGQDRIERRARLRNETAAAFAVCAFVIFVLLMAQLVSQFLEMSGCCQ